MTNSQTTKFALSALIWLAGCPECNPTVKNAAIEISEQVHK